MKCPVCNSEIKIKETIKEIPHFGKVRIVSLQCPNCGWHRADVHLLAEGNPKEFSFKVNEETLRKLFVKTEGTSIEIPELDLELKPIFGENRITTVEGILDDFIERVEQLKRDNPNNEKVKKILQALKEAKEGKRELEVKVRDIYGIAKLMDNPVKEDNEKAIKPPK